MEHGVYAWELLLEFRLEFFSSNIILDLDVLFLARLVISFPFLEFCVLLLVC